MTDRANEDGVKSLVGAACGLLGAAVILGAVVFAVPRPADALPSYAKQTGLSCGSCHVSPAGGGPRTALGKAFAANGHKLPSKGKPGTTSAGGEALPMAPAAEIVAHEGGGLSPPPAWPRRCNGWCPSRRY